MQSEKTDVKKFREDFAKASEVPADATTIRKDSIQKAQEEAFLQSYDGKDICLRFPITDIHTYGHGAGVYLLNQEIEVSYNLQPQVDFFRLSASEAAWVSKGDWLTIRGKANFSFDYDNTDRQAHYTVDSPNRASRRGRPVYVTIDKPKYAIVRR